MHTSQLLSEISVCSQHVNFIMSVYRIVLSILSALLEFTLSYNKTRLRRLFFTDYSQNYGYRGIDGSVLAIY
jgi:hypothetical protein